MAPSTATGIFPLMNLAAELRERIYKYLLCSWDEREGNLLPFTHRKLYLAISGAAILRTSRQVYREATAVSRRVNRFVRISTIGCLLDRLFMCEDVPFVTVDAQTVKNFPDYAVHIILSKRNTPSSSASDGKCEMLLLHVDLLTVCKWLDIESITSDLDPAPNQVQTPTMSIHINDAHKSPPLTAQEELLKPLETLRGLHHVSFQPSIHPNLSSTLIPIIAQPRWTDPDCFLRELCSLVFWGEWLWELGQRAGAVSCWTVALRKLDCARYGTSWQCLLAHENGSQGFVNAVANFSFELNLASVRMPIWEMTKHRERASRRVTSSAADSTAAGSAAVNLSSPPVDVAAIQAPYERSKMHITNCMNTSADFALYAGATWQQNALQQAAMCHAGALSIRLADDVRGLRTASILCGVALTLCPTVAEYIAEWDLLEEWAQDIMERENGPK